MSISRRPRNIFLALIVILEILISGSLFYFLFIRGKERAITKSPHIIPIKKEYLLFEPSSDLKYFFEPKPNDVIVENFDWLQAEVRNTINADSLNAPRDYQAPKPDGVFRIIALGDSFTFGQHVNTEDNYPSQLETRLNVECGQRFEVLNLGVMGYDLVYAAHRYQKRGVKYDPDLLLFLINDHNFYAMPELFFEKYEQLELEFTEEQREEFRKKGEFAPAWNLAEIDVRKNYNEAHIIEQEYAALYQISRVFSGPMVYLVFDNMNPRFVSYLKMIKANDLHSNHLQTLPTMRQDRGEMLADGHPSTQGYRMMVEHILSHLKEEQLVPCEDGDR